MSGTVRPPPPPSPGAAGSTPVAGTAPRPPRAATGLGMGRAPTTLGGRAPQVAAAPQAAAPPPASGPISAPVAPASGPVPSAPTVDVTPTPMSPGVVALPKPDEPVPSVRIPVSSNPSIVASSATQLPGRASLADLPLCCPTCLVRYPAEFRVCPRDASELISADGEEESTDDLVGQTLAATYAITRVIGEGGMGRVYEARHQRVGGKRFAIKMLHPEYARMPEVLSRFQREAEASAKIQHQNVAEVYDVAKTADGRPFMVAEFLEGEELAAHLEKIGRMPVPGAVRIVRQLCRGLSAAHALGIVHRDMKPENVFLTGDLSRPTAKIIDFGISKAGDAGGTNLTKTGMIMGTPSFMAPEQAKGERVTHLADVYAVGAILYTLLTGQRPFDKPDATATLTAVLIEEPPRPRSIEPSIPDGLEAVIQKSMAKSANDRYASLDELEAALAPWELGTLGIGGASLAPPRMPASSQLELDVSWARPAVLVLGGLAAFAALTALPTLIGAFVRIARGSDSRANLEGSEAFIVLAFVVVALAAPVGLLVHRIKTKLWDNTARVLDLALALRWPVLVGFGAYGLASLFIRFFESVLVRRAVGASWPVWDVLLFLIGAGAAGIVAALPRLNKKR